MRHRKERQQPENHQLGFETSKLVLDDPNCLTFVERTRHGEERWHAIGIVGEQVMITVVHAYRAERQMETIRTISARGAGPHQRKLCAGTY